MVRVVVQAAAIVATVVCLIGLHPLLLRTPCLDSARPALERDPLAVVDAAVASETVSKTLPVC